MVVTPLDLEEGQAAYVATKLLNRRVIHDAYLPGVSRPARIHRWMSNKLEERDQICLVAINFPDELMSLGYSERSLYYLSVAAGRNPAEAFAIAMQEAKMILSQVAAQLEMLEAYANP